MHLMTADTKSAKRGVQPGWRIPDSIYLKCLFALVLTLGLNIGLASYLSIHATNTTASQSILKIGSEVVVQIGERIGPVLDLRDSDGVTALLRSTTESLRGSVSGALVMTADGEIVAQEFLTDGTPRFLTEAAQRALQDEAVWQDSETLVIAVPVRSRADNELIGVVALNWRSDALYATVKKHKETTFLLSSGLGLVLLIVIGALIKRTVERPLLQIASSMKKIARGDYLTEIPKFRRGNEIGVVARTLDEFRTQLQTTEASRKDAAMKSAALDAGSAAIMIADAEFHVVYASTAVLNLLIAHHDLIGSRITGFDPERVVGQSFDDICKLAEVEPGMFDSIDPAGHLLNVEIGAVNLELKVSKIDDGADNRIGYVIEWADVSEQRRNAAVLASLDCNQARAEFGQNGRLLEANTAFLSLAGLDAPNEGFEFVRAISVKGVPVSQDTAMFAEFEIQSPDSKRSFILGGLSPVFSSKGELNRTVLIGADVTEVHKRKQETAEERTRLREEQDAMIKSLSDALSALASGDLTTRITDAFAGANDQVRQDFNVAVERLEDAINSVIFSATTIGSEVEALAAADAELSKRTESQAATLEETAAAVSEISASVNSSAEGANSVHAIVDTAQGNVVASGSVVKDAVAAMGNIAQSSAEITSIVKVIDDIAFQTNLLALNAGVEAARAGNAGRGFAVVASEVRNLAQRSSDAANEISALIAASSENVDLGVKLVGNAGTALERIIASISDISGYVSDMASASRDQSLNIAEINTAMSHLDQVTQENAAMFERTTAASLNLSQVSSELMHRVQRFRSFEQTGDRHEHAEEPGQEAESDAAAKWRSIA